MNAATDAPVLFVVGPTASGKTALAIDLARRFDGEIINADSRQFYRGMDIGTAKPTVAEQAAARHHLIDVADPDESLSLGWFLDRAHAALAEVRSRGRLPIIAGGTGQYVRALLEGWDVPRVPPNPALRATLEERLQREGLASLVEALQTRDPVAAARIDLKNKRRVVRALEIALHDGPPTTGAGGMPAGRGFMLGIHFEREALYARIDARVDAMFESGLVEEVDALIARGYGCDLPSMSAIGYREVCDHLRGVLTLKEARSRTKLNTHRLARIQAGWFRRSDSRITWLDAGPGLGDRAADALRTFLSSTAPLE